jgi:hypothetical protein
MPDMHWWNGLFAAIDAKDTGAFLARLTTDASFRFGSAAPVQGAHAIAHAVDGFFASIAASEHKILRLWHDDDSAACQGEVTYTRHDGSVITLPFTNVFNFAHGKVREYLIYIDIAPLYQPE